MRVTRYGIANCDKVRAARAWPARRGVAAGFHDFKKPGVTPGVIGASIHQLNEHIGIDALDALKSIYRQVPERLLLPA